MTPFPQLHPILPELVIAVGAIALLMVGVFRRENATRSVTWAAAIVLVAAGVIEHYGSVGRVETFGGQFVVDGFARFSKELVLLASAISLILAAGWLRREQAERVEFPVLVMFATLGMVLMISANNLISLYLSLELQSLSLYVLAAFQRDNARSTEAGLKYFVLGSLASGMLLYGASLVYGFAGTTGFDALAHAFAGGIPHWRDHRRRLRPGRLGLQGFRRAVPYVDARRLRGRADSGHGAFLGGAQGRRLRAAGRASWSDPSAR